MPKYRNSTVLSSLPPTVCMHAAAASSALWRPCEYTHTNTRPYIHDIIVVVVVVACRHCMNTFTFLFLFIFLHSFCTAATICLCVCVADFPPWCVHQLFGTTNQPHSEDLRFCAVSVPALCISMRRKITTRHNGCAPPTSGERLRGDALAESGRAV